MDTTPLPNIPDRFGEQNWRRFESLVRAYVGQFPKPLIFKPGKLSQATAVARLRDAVRAFLHPSTEWASDVSYKDLQPIWDSSIVRPLNDGNVYFGPKEQTFLENDVGALPTSFQDIRLIDATNEEVFRAMLIVKNFDVIAQPMHLKNVTLAQQDYCAEHYPNAVLLDNGDGTFTLI